MADTFQFWTKAQELLTIKEDDQGLTTVFSEHPEVKVLYERRSLYPDFLSINGVNPIFHVLMEAVVENQLQDPSLPEVRKIYEKLQSERSLTPHAARACIANLFIYDFFPVLNEEKPFDTEGYVRRLSLIGENVSKLGRNDRCPCGSGAKFKRCCAPYADAFEIYPLAGRLDLGYGSYLLKEPEYTNNPLDPIFQLEARFHIADYMEESGDLEGALAVLNESITLAESYESGKFLKNAWQDYLLLCENHPALETEGLKAFEHLFLLAEDDKEKGNLLCDKADFLVETGNMEAAVAEYTALFGLLPDYHFGRYRYALMLSEHEREDDARDVLQNLLSDSHIDEEIREEAAFLLEDLE